MSWSNDDLQPLDFEEVTGDEEDDSGLPPVKWEALCSIDTGQGDRSLEPDPLFPFTIRHNDTVSRESVIEFLKQLKVKCGITEDEVDIPNSTEDHSSDEEGTRSLSVEDEADDSIFDNCLVVVLDFDKIDEASLPDNGVLTFKIDPKINEGLKHMYSFAGSRSGVTTAVVELMAGSVEARFVNAQTRMALSSKNQQATLTDERAKPGLLITAIQTSEYELSGTRNLGYSEIRA